jgi:hypothetical protein
MQKQLESMPPDERRKIEQMMGSQLSAKSSSGQLAAIANQRHLAAGDF